MVTVSVMPRTSVLLVAVVESVMDVVESATAVVKAEVLVATADISTVGTSLFMIASAIVVKAGDVAKTISVEASVVVMGIVIVKVVAAVVISG